MLADSDLFGDDCIDELGHAALWINLAYWVARPSFERPYAQPTDSPATDPSWIRLTNAVEKLRALQAPDGSIPPEAHDPDSTRELVTAIAARAEALRHRFPHQAEYIDAVRDDLAKWAEDGFGEPDFARSMEAFRPERDRRDGIEHLVVFPMYKQNASRDTCFEALLVRVPWPEWIAELERTRYDNAKYLPVTFVDYTSGYDSECAVLFPETFSTAERPSEYHFGAIFCDREAERFRRVCGAAADVLRLNLPPDAACLLHSPELSRDAYILWDLIHDRTHMRGDLPFDPFMIRQRSPYWMYALEELRCDLTAFGEAVEARGRGLRLRPSRPVRDPLRPPLPLPDHRQPGPQLRRARRPAPLRLPAPRGLPALDGQPPDDRLGADRRRSRRPARARPRPLPLGHRPLQALPVDRGPRPGRRLRAADRELRLGHRPPRPARGRGARSSSSTSSATTSSRSASSTSSSRRSSSRRWRAPPPDSVRRVSELEGRVIAIAGAAGGLGPAVARRLAAERRQPGAHRPRPGAARLARRRARARISSVSTPRWSTCSARRRRATGPKRLVDRFGRVDGLLHLVGGWRGGEPLASFDLGDYEFLHDLLVRTVIHATRAFHDQLAASEHGRFVLVSSAQAQDPDGTNAAYGATKAAAETWTLALADSFRKAESAATANVIVVNAILTEAMRAESPEKPFRTFTSAEDIAAAIAFLCSDAGAKMNGKRLPLHPLR